MEVLALVWTWFSIGNTIQPPVNGSCAGVAVSFANLTYGSNLYDLIYVIGVTALEFWKYNILLLIANFGRDKWWAFNNLLRLDWVIVGCIMLLYHGLGGVFYILFYPYYALLCCLPCRYLLRPRSVSDTEIQMNPVQMDPSSA